MNITKQLKNDVAEALTDYPVCGTDVFDFAAKLLGKEYTGKHFLHDCNWSEGKIADCIDEDGNIIDDKAEELVNDFIAYMTADKKLIKYQLYYNDCCMRAGELYAESEQVEDNDWKLIAIELINLRGQLGDNYIADCCDAAEMKYMFGDDLPCEVKAGKWYTSIDGRNWQQHDSELEACKAIAQALEGESWADCNLRKVVVDSEQ